MLTMLLLFEPDSWVRLFIFYFSQRGWKYKNLFISISSMQSCNWSMSSEHVLKVPVRQNKEKVNVKWIYNFLKISFSFILNWKVLFQQKKLMHDHTSMRTDGFRSKPLFGYRYVNILHALYLIIISHDFMASGLW